VLSLLLVVVYLFYCNNWGKLTLQKAASKPACLFKFVWQ
jgi:hypothetical protein